MKQKEFKEVCEAVATGEHKLVENMPLRYVGEVIDCKSGVLVVEAFGHRFDWPRDDCRSSDGQQDPLGPPTNV
jgi:hypothetical protein